MFRQPVFTCFLPQLDYVPRNLEYLMLRQTSRTEMFQIFFSELFLSLTFRFYSLSEIWMQVHQKEINGMHLKAFPPTNQMRHMPEKKKQHKDEGDDRELQKKYLLLQVARQQLSALVEEKQTLNERAAELITTISALKKLTDVKKGEEIWSSLGSGAFARSDIKDTSNVLVAAGAGVVIKETRERGIEILSARLAELQKVDTELVNEITRLSGQAGQLEKELQHAVENR